MMTVRLFSSARLALEDDGLAIDCLISDIGMPEMNGFELLRLARLARPDLPVIFITARNDTADEVRAAAEGRRVLPEAVRPVRSARSRRPGACTLACSEGRACQ
jgi:CheY-like chemotaxis protein